MANKIGFSIFFLPLRTVVDKRSWINVGLSIAQSGGTIKRGMGIRWNDRIESDTMSNVRVREIAHFFRGMKIRKERILWNRKRITTGDIS